MTDISDHAVLRFIERVYGVDIDRVRAEMDSPALAKAVEFGSRVLIGRHGERLVIRDGIVVTVIGKGNMVGRTIRA